ncbi:hypothetical protein B0H11DRAFT_2415066 [Mycena galericulata]|nr:hypothetical protein B0H11DRAFT_2415066 [Mycena galericulata]
MRGPIPVLFVDPWDIALPPARKIEHPPTALRATTAWNIAHLQSTLSRFLVPYLDGDDAAALPSLAALGLPFLLPGPDATAEELIAHADCGAAPATKEEVAMLRGRFEAELARQTANTAKHAAANKLMAALPATKAECSGRTQPRTRTTNNANTTTSSSTPPLAKAKLDSADPAALMGLKLWGKKKKRPALANASNPHHLRNYANANTQSYFGPLPLRFLSVDIPPRRRRGRSKKAPAPAVEQPVVTNPAEEWSCAFCESDLFYRNDRQHRRAVRNRKKIPRRRRRARERAAAVASGTRRAKAQPEKPQEEYEMHSGYVLGVELSILSSMSAITPRTPDSTHKGSKTTQAFRPPSPSGRAVRAAWHPCTTLSSNEAHDLFYTVCTEPLSDAHFNVPAKTISAFRQPLRHISLTLCVRAFCAPSSSCLDALEVPQKKIRSSVQPSDADYFHSNADLETFSGIAGVSEAASLPAKRLVGQPDGSTSKNELPQTTLDIFPEPGKCLAGRSSKRRSWSVSLLPASIPACAPAVVEPAVERNDWAEHAYSEPDDVLYVLLAAVDPPNRVENACKSHLVSLALPPNPSLRLARERHHPNHPLALFHPPSFSSPTTSLSSPLRRPPAPRLPPRTHSRLSSNGMACPACTSHGHIRSGSLACRARPLWAILRRRLHLPTYACANDHVHASTDASARRALPVALEREIPARFLTGAVGAGADVCIGEAHKVSRAVYLVLGALLRTSSCSPCAPCSTAYGRASGRREAGYERGPAGIPMEEDEGRGGTARTGSDTGRSGAGDSCQRDLCLPTFDPTQRKRPYPFGDDMALGAAPPVCAIRHGLRPAQRKLPYLFPVRRGNGSGVQGKDATSVRARAWSAASLHVAVE